VASVKPHYSDGQATLYRGDCREVLRELPAASVQCVVTSPPYWAQRNYGLGEWVGGDPDCDHERNTTGDGPKQTGASVSSHAAAADRLGACRCGATLVSTGIGLEPTPQAWIAAMVDVMRGVRRVLRDDGVCWLNLGDKYAGSGGAGGDYNEGGLKAKAAGTGPRASPVRRPSRTADHGGWCNESNQIVRLPPIGFAAKNLLLLPHRLAIALQEDGWIVRQDIVWAKPAPMPESCTDRPTRAHEYIFLLSKQGRYFYDADAVREPGSLNSHGGGQIHPGRYTFMSGRNDRNSDFNRGIPAGEAGRNLRSVWTMSSEPFDMEMCEHCGMIYDGAAYRRLARGATVRCIAEVDNGNRCGGTSWTVLDGTMMCDACGTVYTLAEAKQLPKAPRCRKCGRDDSWMSHYAIFPSELPRRCILAGTSEKGCCPECGAPWERVVKRDRTFESGSGRSGNMPVGKNGSGMQGGGETLDVRRGPTVTTLTTSWRPTCDHDAEPVPCVVLDPFAGTGTTLKVAKALGRHAVGIELSKGYCKMAEKRCGQMGMAL